MNRQENKRLIATQVHIDMQVDFFEFQVGQKKIKRLIPVPRKLILINGISFDIFGKKATYNGEILSLSKARFDVLYTICRKRGQLISEKEIFDEIWGDGKKEYSPNLIPAYVKQIRKVLGRRSIHNKRKEGYCLNIDHGRPPEG